VVDTRDHRGGSGPSTLIGAGSVTALARVAEETAGAAFGPARIVLVVGAGFRRRAWRHRVLGALGAGPYDGRGGARAHRRRARLVVAVHEGPPTPDSVAGLARRVHAHRPDLVVAVGGGSVMDAAKSAAALARYPRHDRELVLRCCANGQPGGGSPAPAGGSGDSGDAAVPVVAVPTTPGTGAEATPFATVWDVEAGRKLSLRGPDLQPAAAILDADLLVGLPAERLAGCMLDSVAQGIEASWSTRADEEAETFGQAAVRELSGLLDRAPEGLDAAARQSLMLAGHYSGRAIAIAGTTLCHALSYPITLRYGLAHGHACGLTLARVLAFNAQVEDADCEDPRGARRVRRAIAGSVAAADAGDVDELARRVEAFLAAARLATLATLSPAAELAAAAGEIAHDALSYDRAGNNPRRPDREKVVRLLTAAP
jgi:alcohol dehydrogenase class IV